MSLPINVFQKHWKANFHTKLNLKMHVINALDMKQRPHSAKGEVLKER
jgi:hypothetical protein